MTDALLKLACERFADKFYEERNAYKLLSRDEKETLRVAMLAAVAVFQNDYADKIVRATRYRQARWSKTEGGQDVATVEGKVVEP